MRFAFVLMLASICGFLRAQPTAGIGISDSSGCPPFSVQFSDLSSGHNQLRWTFNDTLASLATNPSMIFQDPGYHKVCLEVWDSVSGQRDTLVFDSIHVVENPVADFSYQLLGDCENNNQVCFQTLTPGADSTIWFMNNGDLRYDSSFCYSYGFDDSFFVSLTVTNAYGCKDVKTLQQPIVIKPVSSSNLSVDHTSSCDIADVFIFNQSNPGKNLVAWDFGDGNQSSKANPSHTYNQGGSFRVSLIMDEANGCRDTTFLPGTIDVQASNPIQIDIADSTKCLPFQISYQVNYPGLLQAMWYTGDGDSILGDKLNKTYQQAGIYPLSFRYTDSLGCDHLWSGQASMEIKAAPTASYNTLISGTCAPVRVDFNAPGSYASVEWDFLGDGTQTANGAVHFFEYRDSGVYFPRITVTDNSGCSRTEIVDTVVVIANQLSISADKTTGCAPLNVNFSLQSQIPGLRHNWTFGNGLGSGRFVNQQFSFNRPGKYDVQVIVTDLNRCNDTLQIPDMIEVTTSAPAPVVNPYVFKECAPFNIDLDPGRLGYTSWDWNFGTGDTSILKKPSYEYDTSGVYVISLSSFNADGCPYTIDTFAVVDIDKPKADYVIDTIDCASMSATLTDASSDAVSREWVFETGQTDTGLQSWQTFPLALPYSFELEVSSKNGCTDRVVATGMLDFRHCDTVYMQMMDTLEVKMVLAQLKQSLQMRPISGCAPLSLNLNSRLQGVSHVEWHFGDGGIVTGVAPKYTFENPGIFDLTLYVTDTSGQKDTMYLADYASIGMAEADFSYEFGPACDFSKVQFTDNSMQHPLAWKWSYHTGLIDTMQNPLVTYDTTNTVYPVGLYVEDSLGCSDELYKVLYIGNPDVRLNYPLEFCYGDSLEFRAEYDDSVGIYWTVAGQIGLTPVWNTAIPKGGSYELLVIAQYDNGCMDTIRRDSLHVIQPILDLDFPKGLDLCLSERFQIRHNTIHDNYAYAIDGGSLKYHQNPLVDVQVHSIVSDLYIQVDESGCLADTSLIGGINVGFPNARAQLDNNAKCAHHPMLLHVTGNAIEQVSWFFPDGTTDTGSSVWHTFDDSLGVMAGALVYDSIGCRDSVVLNTSTRVKAAFSPDVTHGCAPLQVKFTDQSANGQFYEWHFGDGNTSNSRHPSHTYTQDGIYSVMLITTRSCRDTVVYDSLIHVEKGQARFNYQLQQGASCAPSQVMFVDQSSLVASHKWNFSDNNASNFQNPINIFQQPGFYSAELIITDVYGCQDTAFMDSIRIPGPIVDFSVSDTTGCQGIDLHFNATASNYDSLVWNFGDGNTSNSLNPVYAYKTTGLFSITLTAIDSSGCRTVVSRNNHIEINDLPDFDLDAGNPYGCVPHTVQFSNNSTGLDNIIWDFYGDTVINDPNLTQFVIDTVGMFTITANMLSGSGCPDSAVSFIVQVEPSVDASFNMSDSVGCGELEVQFSNTSSHQQYATWDFGDGQSSSDINPKHTFDQPGTYEIVLALVDSSSSCFPAGIFADTVVVHALPTLDSIPDTSACSPFALSLPPAGQGQQLQWQFNGIQPDVPGKGSLTYSAFGQGSINAFLLNQAGCADTVSYLKMQVHQKPHAEFIADVRTGCPPLNVNFTNMSTGAALMSYDWQMGNGSSSQQQHPSAVYGSGHFDVQLVTTNQFGCADTAVEDAFIQTSLGHQGYTADFRRVSVENEGEIELEWNPIQHPYFGAYRIYRKTNGRSTYQLVQVISDPLTQQFTDKGIDTRGNSYCYRLVLEDACGNITSLEQTSDHCSILLETANKSDNFVDLNWSAYVGCPVSEYRIFRSKPQSGNSWQVIGTVGASQLNFTDSSAYCNHGLVYKVEARDLCGLPIESKSNGSDITPQGLPKSQFRPEIFFSTVVDNSEIKTVWRLNDFNRPYTNGIELFRSENGRDRKLVGHFASDKTEFFDRDVKVDRLNYTYEIELDNNCVNARLKSNRSGNIVLESTGQQNGMIALFWTEYDEWAEGVERYMVQYQDDNGDWQDLLEYGNLELMASIESELHPEIHRFSHSALLRVVAFPVVGDYASVSNEVEVDLEVDIYIPNSFTPNGDGLNDDFRMFTTDLGYFDLRIFNRWGEMVFQTQETEFSWDGTFRGEVCQEGVYMYEIKAGKLTTGKSLNRKGTISLLR